MAAFPRIIDKTQKIHEVNYGIKRSISAALTVHYNFWARQHSGNARRPVAIASPSHSRLFDNSHPELYEIRDSGLSQTLLNNKKIFRLPSNAELGFKENLVVYNAYNFPRWSLCPNHGILYRYESQSLIDCPHCPKKRTWVEAWAKSREEAVRFVLACSHGHVDEVPWGSLMKHKGKCSGSNFYKWEGGGGAIKNIQITCPNCDAKENFGTAYSRKFKCRGRFIERGSEEGTECAKPAKIIQRGAANLRVSEIRSALTIPPLDTSLHRLLQSRAVLDILILIAVDFKNQLVENLNKLVKVNRLDPTIAETINQYEEAEIMGGSLTF